MIDSRALVAALRAEDPESQSRIRGLAYDQLRHLARGFMRRERGDHTLDPTDLVNEACLRLMPKAGLDEESRGRLMGHAAHAMRQVLVDHARRNEAWKRGGGWCRVTLRGLDAERQEDGVPLVALMSALDHLEKQDPGLAQITDWHYFGGLTGDQIAKRLGVSRSTVTRELSLARALLLRTIDRLDADGI